MFKKGDEVYVLDYPFGKPINCRGVIVGVLGDEHYNVLMKSGFHEGQIMRHKYWKLLLTSEEEDDILLQ